MTEDLDNEHEHEKVIIEKESKVVVEKEAIHPYRWRFLWICLLVIGIAFFFTIRDLRHKDSEIQNSRVISCKKNYGAFNEVFRPFFPPPDKRTKMQQDNLDKLHATVRRLQANCEHQTRVSK